MLHDRLHPFAHVFESVLVSDVKGHDNAIRLLVKGVSQRAESLLAGSIPDFNLEVLIRALRLESLADVVEAERCHMGLLELAFSVHLEEGGFAYCAIAEHNNIDFVCTCTCHFLYLFLN